MKKWTLLFILIFALVPITAMAAEAQANGLTDGYIWYGGEMMTYEEFDYWLVNSDFTLDEISDIFDALGYARGERTLISDMTVTFLIDKYDESQIFYIFEVDPLHLPIPYLIRVDEYHHFDPETQTFYIHVEWQPIEDSEETVEFDYSFDGYDEPAPWDADLHYFKNYEEVIHVFFTDPVEWPYTELHLTHLISERGVVVPNLIAAPDTDEELSAVLSEISFNVRQIGYFGHVLNIDDTTFDVPERNILHIPAYLGLDRFHLLYGDDTVLIWWNHMKGTWGAEHIITD